MMTTNRRQGRIYRLVLYLPPVMRVLVLLHQPVAGTPLVLELHRLLHCQLHKLVLHQLHQLNQPQQLLLVMRVLVLLHQPVAGTPPVLELHHQLNQLLVIGLWLC